MLKKKERDKALEQLEEARDAWSKKRTERLNFINGEIQKEHHAAPTFDDVDQAMKQYYYITGKTLLSDLASPLPEPKVSDFYSPSPDQQNREITFVVLGMVVTGFVAYKFL